MRKLLICTMVISMIFSTVVFGAGNTILSIPGKEAVVDEEITINLNLETTEEICSGSFKLKYDTSGMELISCEKGSSFGTRTPTINEAYADDMVYVGWTGQVPLESGILLSFKFRVLNPGIYAFEIKDAKLLTIDVSSVTPDVQVENIVAIDANEFIYGDIYTDGKVNSADAIKLAQKLARWNVSFTEQELLAADVYRDGNINSADAIKLAQKLARWNVVLGTN